MRVVAFGVGLATALGVVSVAAAVLDDPDAPVATARYIGAPGAGPRAAEGSDPSLDVPRAPALSARTAPPRVDIAAPGSGSAGRFNLAIEEARSRVDAVAGKLAGLATKAPPGAEAVTDLNRFSAPVSRMVQDRNLRRGFGEMRAVGEKARLFLFAGDQSGVWTYNFTRDGGGVKAAGWTAERGDLAGEQRFGVAWQKGRARIALTGMERKFCQFGAEVKDRVVAMSVSFSPGWSTRRDHQSS